MLTIILTCLLAVSAVSAANNATDDIISTDVASADVVSVDNDNQVNAVENGTDNAIGASDDTIANDEILTTEESSDDALVIDENNIITKVDEDKNNAGTVLTVKNDEKSLSIVEGESISIIVYKQTGKYASDKKLYFRVTDSSDNPVYVSDNSLKLIFVANENNYNIATSTNSNGEGSFNWPDPKMTVGGSFKTYLFVNTIFGLGVLSSINMFKVSISSKNTNHAVTQPVKQILIIKPTKLSTAYKSGKKFRAKVINSKTKKAVKGAEITMKVYTGKNAKTITLKSNAQGIVKFSSSRLGIGTHKVVLKVKKSKTYTGKSKTSYIKISKATLKISAPKVTKYYKKAGKFKVTVKSKANGKAVKGVKVIMKVYTGKKVKKYVVKTNSRGQIAVSTKSLSKGKHKVIITIKGNSKFKKASAKSSIKIIRKAKSKTTKNKNSGSSKVPDGYVREYYSFTSRTPGPSYQYAPQTYTPPNQYYTPPTYGLY